MLLCTTVLIILLCGGLRAEEAVVEPKDDTDLTDTINTILDCIRPKLIAGLPETNVPSLDPLQINEINLDDLGGGFAYLNNLTVKGISDLSASYVSHDGGSLCSVGICLGLTVELLIPSLSLTTGYNADVTLFDTLRVYGNGDISLKIDQIEPKLGITITLGTSTGVSDLSVNLGVEDVNFKATGLLDDEYMSGLISNMIGSIIKDHLNEILQNVVALLTSAIENGEGVGDIDTDKLLSILEELLSGCLDLEGDTKAHKIDALLRRH